MLFLTKYILHQRYQMLTEQKLRRSTDVEIPTSGAGSSSPSQISQCSLIKLLGLLVKWSALLDNGETLDVQSFAGLRNCCEPASKDRLGLGSLLLADDLAIFVLHEVRFSQSSCGLGDLACKSMTLGESCRDWLLLHCLH